MYENLKKMVKAGDDLVKVGEDVFEDGEIDFADISQVTRLVAPVQELYEVFKAKDGLKDEIMAFLDEKLEELKS